MGTCVNLTTSTRKGEDKTKRMDNGKVQMVDFVHVSWPILGSGVDQVKNRFVGCRYLYV